MFKQNLKSSKLFKIITLLTIQTFIFTSSVFAYPTLGNASKVEKELRQSSAIFNPAKEEIEGKLGYKPGEGPGGVLYDVAVPLESPRELAEKIKKLTASMREKMEGILGYDYPLVKDEKIKKAMQRANQEEWKYLSTRENDFEELISDFNELLEYLKEAKSIIADTDITDIKRFATDMGIIPTIEAAISAFEPVRKLTPEKLWEENWRYIETGIPVPLQGIFVPEKDQEEAADQRQLEVLRTTFKEWYRTLNEHRPTINKVAVILSVDWDIWGWGSGSNYTKIQRRDNRAITRDVSLVTGNVEPMAIGGMAVKIAKREDEIAGRDEGIIILIKTLYDRSEPDDVRIKAANKLKEIGMPEAIFALQALVVLSNLDGESADLVSEVFKLLGGSVRGDVSQATDIFISRFKEEKISLELARFMGYFFRLGKLVEAVVMAESLHLKKLAKKEGEGPGGVLYDGAETDIFYNFELLSRIPSYEQLKGKIAGKNVLIRVNMNEPDPEKDATRLEMQEEIIRFVLEEGGTPILFGHGGRIDRTADKKKITKDDRFLFDAQAEYIQKLFPDYQVAYHRDSIGMFRKIDEIDKGEGLRITRKDIVPGAINILQNVRGDQGAETGSFRKGFADQLAQLSDGILIFDCFGDIDSKGASVEDVALSPYIQKVYVGPEMMKEFNDIKAELAEKCDVIITGGIKLEKLRKLIGAMNQSLKDEDGFVLLGSGLSYELEQKPEELEKFKALGKKIIFSSDYSDETHYDIGRGAVKEFLAKLDTLKPGSKVWVNGTMGLMEGDEKYKEGTKKVFEKLDELADRGVKVIVVGGDATKAAKKYGLLKNKGVKSYTGGGVALSLLSGDILGGIKVLSKAQERIQLARAERENNWYKELREQIPGTDEAGQAIKGVETIRKELAENCLYTEYAPEKIEELEKWGTVLEDELFFKHPLFPWIFTQYKNQMPGKKFVLAMKDPIKLETFYENVKKATKGQVDLKDRFDSVISKEVNRNVINKIKSDLGVENIQVIGCSTGWIQGYERFLNSKECLLVFCGVDREGAKLTQTPQALRIGFDAIFYMQKQGLLTEEEVKELRNKTYSAGSDNHFSIEPIGVGEATADFVNKYEAVAISG